MMSVVRRFFQTCSAVLFTAGALLCTSQVAQAQIRIDLQRSHHVQQVLSSGVKYQTSPGIDGRKSIFLEPANLVFILPGGQALQARAEYCALKSTADGRLRTLTFHGQILPDEEAYQIALKLHQAFSIPLDRLEQWKKDIAGKGRDAPTFSTGKKDYYPHVFIGMQSSMNTKYPWYLLIELGWNAEDDDTRDEAWGEMNNPRPPRGLEQASLDSPSGSIYDRKEAYAHLVKAQEELDQKLGQFRNAQGRIVSSPPQSEARQKVAPPASERAVSFRTIGISVIILLALSILWLSLRGRK